MDAKEAQVRMERAEAAVIELQIYDGKLRGLLDMSRASNAGLLAEIEQLREALEAIKEAASSPPKAEAVAFGFAAIATLAEAALKGGA